MKNHWRKMTISGLLLLILVSLGAQNAASQQTNQLQPREPNRSVDPTIPQGWGALGDGVHNDAAAIQAAIDSGATEIFLPNTSANNYNLGATGITINTSVHLRMAQGTRLTYCGADAAILLNTYPNSLDNLALDLCDIYSSGPYGIRLTSGGADGVIYRCLYGQIKVRNIWNYTAAGIRFEPRFNAGHIIVLGFYPSVTKTAIPGLQFVDGVSPNATWEGNYIWLVNSGAQGLYAETGFMSNEVHIDTDSTIDAKVDKIDLAGTLNTFIVVANAPGNMTGSPFIRLRPTANWNAFYGPARYLINVTDESLPGANTFSSPRGITNHLANPSFESWGTVLPMGWTTGDATTVRETSDVRHGKSSVKLTATGAYGNLNQTLPAALIGKKLTLSGWFKALSTNTHAAVIALHDFLGKGFSIPIPKDNKWHFLAVSYDFVGNANKPLALIYANSSGAGSGEVVYADGCVVTVGDTPIWPDDADKNTVGSFTCAPSKDTTVKDVNVAAASMITLEPTNAAAAALQGGAKCLYTSAKVAGASFTVTTANAAAAAGTETFNYRIIN